MESIFKNTESSMTNESNIFFCKFNDNVNLENPKKNIRLANLGIYYTQKNMKFVYNNNDFKI